MSLQTQLTPAPASPERCSRQTDGAVAGLRSPGGAAARVRPDATAFAHRDTGVMVVQAWSSRQPRRPRGSPRRCPGGPARGQQAGRLCQLLLGSAAYTGVAAAYPAAACRRPAAVKRRHDPGNIFRRNHNIRPAHA
jgi:hypothetical protein